MKRAKLVDRLRLLGEKRNALHLAARDARAPTDYEDMRRDRELTLEAAAIEYAVVAIRYLGGAKE
jgi:hypothetical protein